MNLKKLLDNSSVLDLHYTIDKFLPHLNLSYSKVYDLYYELIKIDPNEEYSEHTIRVNKCDDEIDVYFIDPSEPNEKFALDFEYWENVLGMSVKVDPDVYLTRGLAEIIYEMTWNGVNYEEHTKTTKEFTEKLGEVAEDSESLEEI